MPRSSPLVMSLYEAIYTMRMVTQFRPDPVPDAVLHAVLDAATQAPSGGNRQPWRFIVVRDRGLKERLHDIITGEWRRQAQYRARAGLGPPGNTFVRALASSSLADIPVLLVVLSTDRRDQVVGTEEGVNNAVQNLLLTARAYGLGGRITYAHLYDEARIRSTLAVPDELDILAFIPLGYPLGTPGSRHGPKRRRPVSEIAHAERWGRPLALSSPHQQAGPVAGADRDACRSGAGGSSARHQP